MMKTSNPIGDVFVKTKNIQNMIYLNKIWLSQDMATSYWSDLSNKIQNFQKIVWTFYLWLCAVPSFRPINDKALCGWRIGTLQPLQGLTIGSSNITSSSNDLGKRVQFQITFTYSGISRLWLEQAQKNYPHQ